MELPGPDLSRWKPRRLGFFIGGSHTEATDLFMLLTHYLDRIVLNPGSDGRPCNLPPSALKLAGFDRANNLLSYPANAFAGYRILHEYFVLPRKFTFLELQGWENWIDRGKGKQFEIVFELRQAPVALPKITKDHFILNATPVINLFTHEADPFVFDHRLEKIRVQPAGKNPHHYQVFSVDSVTGFAQGSVARKDYTPLELFRRQDGQSNAYEVSYGRSPITDAPEVFVSFAYPANGPEPIKETLSIGLTCTNGDLPEQLQLGDISVQTSDSPGLLTFRNVIPPTSSIDPPLGNNAAWRFLAHLSLNYLPMANAENLRELLQLYLFPEARDKTKVTANLKRIEGIIGFQTEPTDRLVQGMVLRGQTLTLSARQDHFAGLGDLYLFGSVLDAFFGVYSSMNAFTQFELKENLSGESFLWPAKLGDRPLI
jgi:type VI secretion system protein ImpG